MARLLLLTTTTGYQAQQFREAAERIGVPLVLASNNCHALDNPWNDGALSVRFHQPRASAAKIREFALHQPIDGVVAIGDAPTLTAAVAARELGAEFHSPEAVEACRNKFLARERYKAAGMRVPWYTRFKAYADERQAARAAPYPCVLKPLGLSASRGVIRANNETEFAQAFARIRRLLQHKEVKIQREESAGWIQVEGFIAGDEFAVEGLVTGGALRVLAIFDKPDPLEGPFFEETIYVTPTRLAEDGQRELIRCAEQAVAAVGLTHGPVHMEMRMNEEGAWMLDIAARPPERCGLRARTGRSRWKNSSCATQQAKTPAVTSANRARRE
jgi:biotin carboxylase